jgi:adenylosuccinate lyase
MANNNGLTALTAISPVDGRYRKATEKLADYFSEHALIKYRLRIEVEYFIALCHIPLPQLKGINKSAEDKLRKIYVDFSTADAQRVKELESITNHDVKAVEYFIKGKFETLGLSQYKEFIHFGLTSQDINNTAVPLALKECMSDVIESVQEELLAKVDNLAKQWKNVPMLGHTHGQPASPTRLGKELMVFVERIENQQNALESVPVSAKFGGATGNFNAHHVAYPKVDWKKFANGFLKGLGLKRQQFTTQI